jgi:hypothetical protein
MTVVKAIFLLSVLLLAGCSSNTAWRISAGTPQPDAQVHVHTSGDLAALFGLAFLAAGVYEATHGGLGYVYGSTQRPPEMAPERRVSEQDCTKPLDLSLGNIRCK